MMVAVSGVAIAFALAVLIVLWAGGKRWNARVSKENISFSPLRVHQCGSLADLSRILGSRIRYG